MASPFQGSGAGPSHLPSHPSYSGSGSLDMSSNPVIGSVSSESTSSSENSTGLSGNSNSQQQSPRDFNMALLCRIGQESVQEIVVKTTELFQTLKTLQPPDGSTQGISLQEERKAKAQEQMKAIQAAFKKLRRIYEKCSENCAGMEYTHIEVDSLIPMMDDVESRQEDKKPSDAVKYLTEEHKDLVEQVMLKNRQIKEVIDHLRSFIWDINTMLAVRAPI